VALDAGEIAKDRFPPDSVVTLNADFGQEDQFPPPGLNGRCRLGEATFAGMGGKEEHAP
jgi:hypothetical protein